MLYKLCIKEGGNCVDGGNTAIGKCRKALGLTHAHKDKSLLVLEQTYAQILTFALYRAASSTQTVSVQAFFLAPIIQFNAFQIAINIQRDTHVHFLRSFGHSL